MAIVSGTPNGIENEIAVLSVGYLSNTPLGPEWHQVDSAPMPHEYPNPGEGKQPKLIFNTVTKEFRFDIVDAPSE